MLLCELRGPPWERLTTFFKIWIVFFFTDFHFENNRYFDFGDIDRLLEHCDGDDDNDDDEEEGNTSTPFQLDYDLTHIKQETIKFHKWTREK